MRNKILLITLIAILLQSCGIFSKKRITTVVPENTDTISTKQLPGKLWGLDISHYQEITDWDKVEEHKPDFIFLKTTEGSTHQDSKYPIYYQEFRNKKIHVGSYHFFTYLSSGKDQAKNFLSVVKFNKGDLPMVLDVEYAKKMPEKPAIEQEVLAFINTIFQKTKRYPIVYCDFKFYLAYLQNKLPVKCKLWIVDYRGRPNCDWTFWQTTDKYRVGGIKGPVDFNIFNGTPDDFKNLIY